MKPIIKVSATVINRLSSLKEPCLGNLYGVFYDKVQYITALYINNNDDNSNIVQYFPTEIELCGIFEVHKDDDEFDHKKMGNTLGNVLITDNPLYLMVSAYGSTNKIEANYIVNNKLEIANMQVLEDYELYSQFLHIRLRAQIPLACNPDEDSIREALQELKKNFDNGKVAFRFPKANVFILGNDADNGVTGAITEGTVEDLYTADGTVAPKSQNGVLKLDILDVRMFKKVTQDGNIDARKTHAPILCVDKKKYESLNMVLNLDALSMVHKTMPIKNLYETLVASCYRNLFLLQKTILKYFQQSGGDYSKISYPEIYHFYPQICGHFVTRVYGKNETESSLENDRKFIQQRIILPMSKPMFKRGNRYSFPEERSANSPLVNPHESCKLTSNGGEVALVKGNYEYYHYCQNNMDDNGWGCAYRSLQTLASWFRLQGYTEKEVPTYHDIQKCLVDIGDKPAKFIGSKQWIGSMEVGFVLETLLGVSSRVLQASSGAEMATLGPQLITHFNSYGTPIMIGGGVLAHTILGVDYNHETGGIKFLILDPHYTGGEDLKVIVTKGFCGWKGIDFWDKSSFYNMCVPTVPQCL